MTRLKVIVLGIFVFLLAMIPLGLMRRLIPHPNDLSDDIKPISDLFLGSDLVKKVYAGSHNYICFAEDNSHPTDHGEGGIVPTCLEEVTAGCDLFPVGWEDSDNYQTNPWDTYQ
ncbi:MAG: hypothetical protein PHS44_07085, partial [Candidatus Dojkabacteria bacterium]|nr:hypothetical protein [Candidatus Dojkabacteria bacterium]